jgi:hypothetical protein
MRSVDVRDFLTKAVESIGAIRRSDDAGCCKAQSAAGKISRHAILSSMNWG